MNEMFKDLGDSWKNCDRSEVLHKQSMQILKEMSLNTTFYASHDCTFNLIPR